MCGAAAADSARGSAKGSAQTLKKCCLSLEVMIT
jgi:hypothetical protein